jgi:hypothetical protein
MVETVLSGLDLLFIVLLVGVVLAGVFHILLGVGRVGSIEARWEGITLLSLLIAAVWLLPQVLAFLLLLSSGQSPDFSDMDTLLSGLAHEVIAQKDSNVIAGWLYALSPLAPYVMAAAIVLVPVLTIVKLIIHPRFRISNFVLAIVALLILPASMANVTHLSFYALDIPVVVMAEEKAGTVSLAINKDVFSSAEPGNFCPGIPYPSSYEPPEMNDEIYSAMLAQADYLKLFWTHSGLNALTAGTYEAMSCRLTNLTYNSDNIAMLATVLGFQFLTIAAWAAVLLRALSGIWRQMAEGTMPTEALT